MTGIFSIPPDVSFVEALARGLWDESGGDPLKLTDMLVLLPTRRACRTLREAFLRVTNGKAILLPRMQPLGDMDEAELYFSGIALDPAIPPAIEPLRRQMLLMRLIHQKDKTLPLDQAAQLAAALAELLDQVQTTGGDFTNLGNLVPGDLAQHWQETLDFLEIVTATWPDVLRDEGCLDPAERRNRILAAQAEAWRQRPPSHPLIAAGSTASVPAVAALLSVIAAIPPGRVVLPGLDCAMDETAWQQIDESHPQYNMKRWLAFAALERKDVKPWPGTSGERPVRARLLQEAMRPAGTTEAWQTLDSSTLPATAVDGLSRLELEHQQEEAEVIALRLRAALEDRNKTAALITPDRALAARVEAALRRWGIMANDSGGTALAVLPLGSFLRDVLQAAAPEASAIDYLSLLKHPLTAAGVDPAVCRKNARQIETAIWRGVSVANGWQGAVHALRQTDAGQALVGFAEKLAGIFEPMVLEWPLALPFGQRIRQHLQLAEELAGTDALNGALRLWRGEAGEAAVEFFSNWQDAVRDMPPLSGDDYRQLFSALLQTITIRPAYGRHPRLNLLGPLEARLHHADTVILGGLNEGVWPPDAAIDPWLSRPMKRAFGLPLPEMRLGLSAHDFVQLASAPDVLLTRARRVNGAPAVPSRFLLQIEAVLQAAGQHDKEHDALAPQEPWQDWARRLDAADQVRPCPPPEPRPPAEARPHRLSVTEIGTWLRNPYAIYARRILGLTPLEDIDADVTAADRGTIIHDALEQFLKRHKTTWPADPLASLLEIGRTAFAPFNDRPQVAAFWWPRFERIAAWFIEREEERRAAGFRVLAAECQGRIALANEAFTLDGRADRIDRLPDSTAVIIDYKTGTLPTKKDIDSGLEPQLPLLALLAEAGGFEGLNQLNIGQLSYWQLKGSHDGEEKILDISGDLAARISRAQDNLEALVAAFADPAMPYRAVPRPYLAPRYDNYGQLARLAEWDIAGDAP